MMHENYHFSISEQMPEEILQYSFQDTSNMPLAEGQKMHV